MTVQVAIDEKKKKTWAALAFNQIFIRASAVDLPK
jgi:hypothetical protein